MTKGIEVSDGELSKTAIKDRTLDSRSTSPKSRIEGTGKIMTDGTGAGSDIVSHLLGYKPVHLFFFRPGNTNNSPALLVGYPWLSATNDDTTWGVMDNYTFTVTATRSTCNIRVAGRANTLYQYKYYIYVDPAE